LNYSEFPTKHNKIKTKGLKWAVSTSPPNHKKTFNFKTKLMVFLTDFEPIVFYTVVVSVNATVMVCGI